MSAMPQQFHADDLLTVDELADRLKAKRGAVYRMSAAGCPALKVGKELRFMWGDVLEWLRDRSSSTREQATVLPVRGTRRNAEPVETVFSMRKRAASGTLPGGQAW